MAATSASSSIEKIRPILDAIDELRLLKEGDVSLPAIVVIGDHSAGKTSLLESLSGISGLPRGLSVPLIVRLENHPEAEQKLLLQFDDDKKVDIGDETEICHAIQQATADITGGGDAAKGNLVREIVRLAKFPAAKPLNLIFTVKKRGLPDLTLIDLPGIPKNIDELMSEMMMKFLKGEETIILNVISGTVDFPTCDSLRMSLLADISGARTITVVTKCDLFPDDFPGKFEANRLHLGLGFLFVRNQVGTETRDEATRQETTLFNTHHVLSTLDKSKVGIPALATTLVDLQSKAVSRCLPYIYQDIDQRLNTMICDAVTLPGKLQPDALAAFMVEAESIKVSLHEIMIDNFPFEMFNVFYEELRLSSVHSFSVSFLIEEVQVLENARGLQLPIYLPRSAFLALLRSRVNHVSKSLVCFVNRVWVYLKTVCNTVFDDHHGKYPELLPIMKNAAHNVMLRMKDKFEERITEMIEMEKDLEYTCDKNLVAAFEKLMGSRDGFESAIKEMLGAEPSRSFGFYVEGYGNIDVNRDLLYVRSELREQAFELKMKMTAYWDVVLGRMVDCMVLHIQFVTRQMVSKEMNMAIVKDVLVHQGGINKIIVEPSSVAAKMERRIELLKEAKQVIEQSVRRDASRGVKRPRML